MRTMLLGLTVLTAALALSPIRAQAVEYPWCAQYGGPGGEGGRNCGFTTFQQCLATVSGIGGFCERNSFYKGPAPTDGRRTRRRHDRD